MAKAAFESLDVYRLSETLADEVWQMVGRWESFARDTIGKQMVRSADSVGANIAEGFGRGTSQDHCRFLRISRGSLNETMHWLRRAFCRKLISKEQTAKIKPIMDELAPRLNAYLRSVKNSRKPGSAPSKKP